LACKLWQLAPKRPHSPEHSEGSAGKVWAGGGLRSRCGQRLCWCDRGHHSHVLWPRFAASQARALEPGCDWGVVAGVSAAGVHSPYRSTNESIPPKTSPRSLLQPCGSKLLYLRRQGVALGRLYGPVSRSGSWAMKLGAAGAVARNQMIFFCGR
jgi:hypothetical protein